VITSIDLGGARPARRASAESQAHAAGAGTTNPGARVGPISEALLMQTLAQVRPESSIVVEEAPSKSFGHATTTCPFDRPESF